MMEERLGVAERLLDEIRNGIDAARYFARHEAVSGMQLEDPTLVELANAVEQVCADLDDAMMALLEHREQGAEDYDDQAN